MPKRKDPINYQPPPLELDYAPFDEDALERAISATRLEARTDDPGARKRILAGLNTAAVWFRHDRGFVQRPKLSTEVATLESLASVLKKLEWLMPVHWEEDSLTGERDLPHVARGVERLLRDPLDELLRTGGDGKVADLVEIVDDGDLKRAAGDLLRDLAAIGPLVRRAAEAAIAERDGTVDERGRVADRELITSLIDIYTDLFDRPPGLSWNTVSKAPGGPLFRFVRACYTELEESLDDGPLYEQIRAALKERKA